MASNQVATGSVFKLTEQGGQKRVVELRTRALPYRPFTLQTEQRREVSWMQGAPRGTIQTCGPKEGSTSATGKWKTRFLGAADDTAPMQVNGKRVGSAADAVKLFDSICREGQLIKVEWFTEIRTGILAGFNKKYYTAHDVEFELIFEWDGRDESTKQVVTDASPTMGSVSTSMRSSLLGLLNLPVEIPFDWTVFQKVQQLANEVDDAVAALEQLTLSAVKIATAPAVAAASLVGTLNGVVSSCSDMLAYAANKPAEKFSAIPPIEQSPAERMQANFFRCGLSQQSRSLRATALFHRDNTAAMTSPDVAGQFVARAGDDLRTVSMEFYDTPFEWRRIMLFNGLTSPELSPGQVIYIPKINGQTMVGA